jgi:hypothetical protein
MKATVEIIVKVNLDIDEKMFISHNEDYLEQAIPDKNDKYRDAAIESEAVALFVQEMNYEMSSSVVGVEVKSTEILGYDN